MPDPQPSPSPPESPLPAPPPAPNPAAEHAEAEAAVRGQTRAGLDALQRDVESFTAFVKEDNTQFAGEENLEQNFAYRTIKEGLEALFQEAAQIGAPEKIQAAWRTAVLDFVNKKVADYDNLFDSVDKKEAEEIVTAMRDSTKGVGDFEAWVKKSPYAAEYEKWKEAKAEAERQRQEAERKRQEAEQAAREAAERQRQAQETQQQQQEQAALEAEEEADMPFLDRLNHTVTGMEEGKWKTVATKLVAALTGIFVMLSKAPLIGGWVRRNFISNRTLARLGDKNAEVAVRVEEQFRKLGLSRDIANELGGKKTKEVIALIKDPQKLASLTTDTAAQGKLNQLADQLTAKNGATSEVTLFEFMGNNPNWPGVAVAAAAAGAAASAPPAVPAPEPAPAAAPAEAAPNLQNQFTARINDQLKPYQGRTTDLTKGRVEFQLPFISNGQISGVRCIIYGNTFEIGTHKYRMDLPMAANLKSITIEGTVESGSATLVAGKFGFSDNREMPLHEMLSHLETIRQGPPTHQASIGSDTATFTKVA